MPIAPSSQVALDAMRPPALPEIAAAHAELARRPAANAAFNVGGKGSAEAPSEAARAAATESFRRFEAMVLQTFIQNMLPKDGAAVYGKGMAGDLGKSLLAEKVAGVKARRGGIGITKKNRVLGGHYAAEAKPVAETAAAGQAADAGNIKETDRRSLVAPAVLDGMQRSLSELLGAAAPSVDRRPNAVHHRIDQMSLYAPNSHTQGPSIALRSAPEPAVPAINLGALIGRIEDAVEEETALMSTDSDSTSRPRMRGRAAISTSLRGR